MFPRPWLGVWDDWERGGLEGRKGASHCDAREVRAAWEALRRCRGGLGVPVVLELVVPPGAPGSTMCFLDLGSVFELMGSGEEAIERDAGLCRGPLSKRQRLAVKDARWRSGE